MKRLLILSLPLFLLTACLKDDEPEIIIEPVFPVLVSSDTLTTGEKWGLTIGMPAEDLYNKIKTLSFQQPVTNVQVIGNFFSKIEDLENKISLYHAIYLDESFGTSTGIQIAFADDKVSTIYTNSGVKLNRWPSESSLINIKTGDATEGIYQKLLRIRQFPGYSKKFERISIFSKNLKKPYDPGMTLSRQWQFVAISDSSHTYHISVNLTDGKLNSIYYYLYKN